MIVLALDPASLPAFQTLLFLHLQTDDYDSALKLLEKPPAPTLALDFERAYCLYRLSREQEALEALGELKKGRKEMHLEAQVVRFFKLCWYGKYYWADQ